MSKKVVRGEQSPRRHPLSPSQAERWRACHGYFHAVKDLPPGKASKYADDGTKAHAVFEACVLFDQSPERLTHEPSMQWAVAQGLRWLEDYETRFPESKIYAERWVPTGRVLEHSALSELGGTADVSAVNPEELCIGDFKYGSGVFVPVERNPQLTLYLGALRLLHGQRKQYRLVVIQPRANGGPWREFVYTNKQLDEEIEDLVYAARENLGFKGKRRAGEHCRWCSAAGNCPAIREMAAKAAVNDFSDVEV